MSEQFLRFRSFIPSLAIRKVDRFGFNLDDQIWEDANEVAENFNHRQSLCISTAFYLGKLGAS